MKIIKDEYRVAEKRCTCCLGKIDIISQSNNLTNLHFKKSQILMAYVETTQNSV